jgi:hypothetical protein
VVLVVGRRDTSSVAPILPIAHRNEDDDDDNVLLLLLLLLLKLLCYWTKKKLCFSVLGFKERHVFFPSLLVLLVLGFDPLQLFFSPATPISSTTLLQKCICLLLLLLMSNQRKQASSRPWDLLRVSSSSSFCTQSP